MLNIFKKVNLLIKSKYNVSLCMLPPICFGMEEKDEDAKPKVENKTKVKNKPKFEFSNIMREDLKNYINRELQWKKYIMNDNMSICLEKIKAEYGYDLSKQKLMSKLRGEYYEEFFEPAVDLDIELREKFHDILKKDKDVFGKLSKKEKFPFIGKLIKEMKDSLSDIKKNVQYKIGGVSIYGITRGKP